MKRLCWKDKYLAKDLEAGRVGDPWEDCISARLGYTTNEDGRLAQNCMLYRATVPAGMS